jgi:pyruvate carboxylase
VDTADYLYGLRVGVEHTVAIQRGVELFIGLEAIGEADDKGIRTVMTTLNGQLRPVYVRDRGIAVTATSAEKADPNRAGHVAAPFAGVVTVKVQQGAKVVVGDTIATIEAMKMEASITTPVAGTVARTAVSGTAQVEAQDLLVVVE